MMGQNDVSKFLSVPNLPAHSHSPATTTTSTPPRTTPHHTASQWSIMMGQNDVEVPSVPDPPAHVGQ